MKICTEVLEYTPDYRISFALPDFLDAVTFADASVSKQYVSAYGLRWRRMFVRRREPLKFHVTVRGEFLNMSVVVQGFLSEPSLEYTNDHGALALCGSYVEWQDEYQPFHDAASFHEACNWLMKLLS